LGLTEHGYGMLAHDGALTTFQRGRARGRPFVPEPRRRLVFCQGWDAGTPLHRHTAFWARGSLLRMTLSTRQPDRATFSVRGRRARSVRVTASTRLSVPLGVGGWHRVGVDVVRTDRGLRLGSIRVAG
jgi:hypothetical protein